MMMHRQVALYPPDIDKRQIQRYHQRRPAQMRLQEQHQECRTDYRRALPGGIQVAGDPRECEVPQKVIETIRSDMLSPV